MDYGMPTLVELETVEENAALCSKLGLQFVELNMNLPVCQEQALKDISRLTNLQRKYGIYFTIHLDENLNIADFNERVAAAYIETVRSTIDIAKQLKVPTLTMHMNEGVYFTLPDKKVFLFEKYGDIYMEKIKAFRTVCEREIAGTDMYICIENTSGFSPFLQEAVELLLESPVFGLTFDIGHSHGVGNVDEPFILAHQDKLRHFHIHDALGAKNHLPLGTGEIDLQSRIALAKESRCRCVLEVKTVEALTDTVEWLKMWMPY